MLVAIRHHHSMGGGLSALAGNLLDTPSSASGSTKNDKRTNGGRATSRFGTKAGTGSAGRVL